MTQRTDIQSLSGAVLAISATLPATYDAAGYAATSVIYTTVGQVDDFGEHGVSATITKFTPVATGIVAKVKGSKDYGVQSLQMANVPGDAGQIILAAAAESTNRYSVKVTYPLGNGEATNEIHYLDVVVSKSVNKDGTVDNVRMLAVDLELCRKPVVVVAT